MSYSQLIIIAAKYGYVLYGFNYVYLAYVIIDLPVKDIAKNGTD